MPAILVINKIDTVKKEELLAVIATYAAVHEFDAVVPISARTGEGVEELLTEIDKYAIEGPQLFPEDMVSDQPERQLVAEIIREKMLRLLDREVPHGVAVGIERWNEREDGLVEINAVIYCEKASHKGIIIGKRGAMLKEIGQQARADIERMLDAKVFLETVGQGQGGLAQQPVPDAQLRLRGSVNGRGQVAGTRSARGGFR